MKTNQIIIFDTTLRDGEQAPGASMTVNEKLIIANHLQKIGVDVIEAGFAASSPSSFEAIEKISKQANDKTIICSLSRATQNDISQAFEAIKYAQKHRIHTFISTSKIHLEYKIKKSESEVLEMIKSSVAYAKSLTEDVQWSAEDATRTDLDFLCKCVEMATLNGATTINIPDTVGYSLPRDYKELFEKLTKEFPNATFSAHCHNDLGVATANSIAAIGGGARQIECTINGIGERAGNAALEEVVMMLKIRNDFFKNKTTNINTEGIFEISQLVSQITGFNIQKNKAIVGENAFSHTSGIHQDGMIKNPLTYQIISPKDIGKEGNSIVLSKLSGKSALIEKLKELGVDLSNYDFDEIFAKFKELCDKKKNIYNNDLLSLIGLDNFGNTQLLYKTSSNSNEHSVAIEINSGFEISKSEASSKCGILDAGFLAINRIFNIEPILINYEVKSIGKDSDGQAMVSISLTHDYKIFSEKSYNCDVIQASFEAYCTICKNIKNN